MKLVSRSFLGLALTSILAACGSSGSTAPSAEDALVASDGEAATAASAQSTNIGSIVFQNISSVDPDTAATELATATQLWPAGCVTRVKDPTNKDVVDVTFDDCTGPFGLVHLNGEVVVTFSAGSDGSLTATHTGVNLSANGHPITFSATADITVSGSTRNVTWQGAWDRVDEAGDTIAHTSSLSIVVDTSTQCRTTSGTAVTSVDSRVVDSTITGYETCLNTSGVTEGEEGCPSGTIVHTHKATGDSVTVDFDGSATADITGPKGVTFTEPLVCPAANNPAQSM
jgi:hypothetical protein